MTHAPERAFSAPQIESDRACYLESPQTVVDLRGSGFAGEEQFTVVFDGKEVQSGNSRTKSDGTFSGVLVPPQLAEEVRERNFTLDIWTTAGRARTSFGVSRFVALFWPRKGVTARTRVRFAAFGFRLAGLQPKNVYLHYIGPHGRHTGTIRLGRLRGPCGSLTRTKQRRLLPFPAEQLKSGLWTLQFDTNRSYKRLTARNRFVYYAIKVRVQSRRSTTAKTRSASVVSTRTSSPSAN